MPTFTNGSLPFGFGSNGNTDKPYVSNGRATLIESTSLLDQRDIYKQLVDTQDDAEWLDFLWMAGKKEATSMPIYYNMYNDKLYNLIQVGSTADGFLVTAGAGTNLITFTFASTGTTGPAAQQSFNFILKNDLLKFPTTGSVGIVVKKGAADGLLANQIQVSAVVTSAVLNVAQNQTLSAFSNAQQEGSDAPAQRRWLVNKLQNQTQIFRNTMKITDVQNMSKIELEFNGQPYILPYENIQSLQKHRGDISLAMWLGEPSTATFQGQAFATPQTYATQTTRGMDSYITTYGINGQYTTANTFTLQDLSAIEAQLIAARSPFEYMIAGSNAAVATISDFLKNLPSSGVVPAGGAQANGVYSGRMNIDGREIDLEAEKFKHGGFTFNLKAFKVLSNAEVMNYTGSTISKSAYFMPMGKVKTVGGGMADYFRYRYQPQPTPGLGSSETAEIMTGALAPTPTNQEMSLTTTWTSNMGLEVFAPNRFAKFQVNN
jgi:hypothetical protein